MQNKTYATLNRISSLLEEEKKDLQNWLKRQSWLSDYKVLNGKKLISFYDGDGTFYFSLNVPVDKKADGKPSAKWDHNMLDLVNIFGSMYGITDAKIDNKFL